jgi:hypothetical protein
MTTDASMSGDPDRDVSTETAPAIAKMERRRAPRVDARPPAGS